MIHSSDRLSPQQFEADEQKAANHRNIVCFFVSGLTNIVDPLSQELDGFDVLPESFGLSLVQTMEESAPTRDLCIALISMNNSHCYYGMENSRFLMAKLQNKLLPET